MRLKSEDLARTNSKVPISAYSYDGHSGVPTIKNRHARRMQLSSIDGLGPGLHADNMRDRFEVGIASTN
jgi:hypothetical protein